MAPGDESRVCKRIRLNHPLMVEYHSYRAPIRDLSLMGCLIEADLPVPIGQEFPLTILLGSDVKIDVEAVVRRTLHGKGVGVEFVTISQPDSARLREFLSAARKAAA